jgi:aspartyl-tRNA(Asn)/glutamyl-tRNA(Gln) amidotransferase subunit C
MTIDLKTVKHISKLSRISIDDNKAKKLGKDLNSIFSFIEKLNELDLVLSPQIKAQRKQDALLFQNSLRNMGLSEKEAADMSEKNIEESRQI